MAQEMVTPVGSGRYGVGFFTGITEGGSIVGEALYFSHSGSNRGFRCELVAHRTKGYGVVLMTNGDNGSDFGEPLESRVLLTEDKDFGVLAYASGHEAAGVILIRFRARRGACLVRR